MAKQLMFGEDARRKILTGIQTLNDAVKVTMGPTGKVVIIEKSFGAPCVTKDGVTAKEIEFKDPRTWAQMVKEVAIVSKAAATGTTATVLTEAIYRRASRWRTPPVAPTRIEACEGHRSRGPGRRGCDRQALDQGQGLERHRPGRHHLRQP